MEKDRHFSPEEAKVRVGKRIRTEIDFSSVPKGSKGIVTQADISSSSKTATVAIVWDLPRPDKPLMDWFTKDEYDSYLSEIESEPWTGPFWDYGKVNGETYFIRPGQHGGYEGCRVNLNNENIEVLYKTRTLTDAIEKIFFEKEQGKKMLN